MVVYCHRPCFL